MQTAQPIQASGRFLTPRCSESSPADALRNQLVETRRNPLLGLPLVGIPAKLFQIPAPFNNFAGSRKNPDESEGVDSVE
jgi:hypothetical protein